MAGALASDKMPGVLEATAVFGLDQSSGCEARLGPTGQALVRPQPKRQDNKRGGCDWSGSMP